MIYKKCWQWCENKNNRFHFMTENAIVSIFSFTTSAPTIYVLHFVSREMWETFGRSRTLLAGRSPKSYGQRTSRASWNFSASDFELNTTVGKWGLRGGTIDIPQVWRWKWKLLSCFWLFETPWNSPVQSTGVGCYSLLQGIFPTQGSNPGLLHCRWILYQLSHPGSPQVQDHEKVNWRKNKCSIV